MRAIGIDRLDRGRRQREDLPVVGAELLEHPEAHVQVVQERNVEPAFDRAPVDDDLLKPIEKRLREDVIEHVDFHGHGAANGMPRREASTAGCGLRRRRAKAICHAPYKPVLSRP